ncbi:MAG: 30S ribosomal protein S6 [Pirellulales bacterium]|nr:30S ribosomal protein S6 [Pirellulales bacterium]
MSQNVYEGLFIFDSNKYAKDPAASAAALTQAVEALGGEMLASRLWEERRLAYPIDGQRKGTYWLSYFKLDAKQLGALNRQYRLDEGIMRFLLLKVDPRIVETLVSHALTGGSVVIERPSAAPVEEIVT